MNQLTGFLKKQTTATYSWTNKLIENIPFDKWFTTPEIVETNIAWQMGHLILSQYYYTIVLVNGPNKDFAESINLKKYAALFANGKNKGALASEITAEELVDHWKRMQTLTNETFSSLQDAELNNDIFSMPKPHPFVTTKEDAIAWNIKHTMWHCGQIALLKRVIDKPFDFGM